MYNFFWIPINDLPALPEPLKNKFNNVKGDIFVKTPTQLLLNDKGVYESGVIERYKLHPGFKLWINKNIATDYYEVSAQIIGKTTSASPHTDQYRRWHLMYIIDQGGDNVETVWYQEHNKPIWRDEHLYPSNYNNLKELHRAVLPANTWIFFNSRIIHDVQNITSTRQALTVDFWQFPERFRNVVKFDHV